MDASIKDWMLFYFLFFNEGHGKCVSCPPKFQSVITNAELINRGGSSILNMVQPGSGCGRFLLGVKNT